MFQSKQQSNKFQLKSRSNEISQLEGIFLEDVKLKIHKFSLLLNTTSRFLVSRVAYLCQCSVWLQTGRPGDRGSIPSKGERIFPLTSLSRPALGSTQPPVQWVPGVFSSGLNRGRGVTLTTQPYLVPRSRMSRSYTSSPTKRHRGV
jgi:hypothetical protein